MDIQDIFPADIISHLSYCLKKGKTLDISDSPTYLNDHHIIVIAYRLDRLFYFVCDVRDDLNGVAQVVTSSLF